MLGWFIIKLASFNYIGKFDCIDGFIAMHRPAGEICEAKKNRYNENRQNNGRSVTIGNHFKGRPYTATSI